MEREALIRARRRRQALEAIDDEQSRVAALEEQIEAILAESSGGDLDEAVLGRLEPRDQELVREALGLGLEEAVEDEEHPFAGFAFGDEDPPVDEDWLEEELVRLQTELGLARERQGALARYVELLDSTT